MNLTIAAAAFCNWQQATPILQHLGTGSQPAATELATAADMQQLTALLAEPDNGAVVLYAPLDMALEHATGTGIEPSQAMALWQHNATQLIRFCKQQRGKAMLFNLADVLAAPQLFKTLCAQHWSGLAVKQTPAAAGVQTVPTLYRLLEQCLLANTPGLLALSQQLGALAQPLSSAPALAPTASELNRLVADQCAGTLARQQLAEANQQHQRLNQQITTLVQERDAATSDRAERQQENTLLLDQLHQVQEALEANLLEHNTQQAQLEQKLGHTTEQLNQAQAAHNNQLATLRQQIATLTQEKEAALQSAGALAELQQENSQLLEQLFVVQEELEKHLAASQLQAEPQTVVATSTATDANNVTTPAEQASSLKRQLNKRAEKKRLKRKAAELASAPQFNAEWYLNEYPDVAADKLFGKDPALHYLTCGGFEGRNPSPHFNSQDYLDANPDVAAAGFNPLYHYLRFGEAEKRPLY